MAHEETIQAIWDGNLDLVKSLIEKWKENPEKDPELLYYAANAGQSKIVEYLLSIGADVNLGYGKYDILPLVAALKHITIVSLLIENGADVNGVSKSDGRSVLADAAKDGSLEVNQLLIKRGAKLDSRDNLDNIPLHLLLQYRFCGFRPYRELLVLNETSAAVIKLFLENGASLSASNQKGETCDAILQEYRFNYMLWSPDNLAGQQSVKRIDEILALARELEKGRAQAMNVSYSGP